MKDIARQGNRTSGILGMDIRGNQDQDAATRSRRRTRKREEVEEDSKEKTRDEGERQIMQIMRKRNSKLASTFAFMHPRDHSASLPSLSSPLSLRANHPFCPSRLSAIFVNLSFCQSFLPFFSFFSLSSSVLPSITRTHVTRTDCPFSQLFRIHTNPLLLSLPLANLPSFLHLSPHVSCMRNPPVSSSVCTHTLSIKYTFVGGPAMRRPVIYFSSNCNFSNTYCPLDKCARLFLTRLKNTTSAPTAFLEISPRGKADDKDPRRGN